MKFPGEILLGAQSQLLPPSVPYRFFMAAVVFHAASWATIIFAADEVADFNGGPGLVPAAVHALTLGVFAMTVMGALFQLLPVATGRMLRAVWPCKLVSWLYIPGVALLVYGFAIGHHHFMAAGAILTILAFLVFGFLMADVLSRTKGEMKLLVLHGWGALAALLGLTALGIAMIANQEHGFLPADVNFRLAHMIIATFGFMGMLVVGYSQILIPIFALAQAPDEGRGVKAFVLFAAVLGLTLGAVFTGNGALLTFAAAAGVGVAGFHVWTMIQVVRRGMRKNLGLSFVLIKTAWTLLPISLALGVLASTGFLGDRGAVLFIFLSLYGWLLTFLLGVLQRIIPFLAAMNASKEGQTPPRLSELAEERPLKVHAVCHFTALALISYGIVFAHELVIMAGGLAGLSGALAYLWFMLGVLRRMKNFQAREKT